MALRLLHWLRLPFQRPRLGLLVVLVLAVVGCAGYLGGCALWVRWDRGEADRALAEYDFAEGRRRLARCVWLRPRDPELRLLAARAARRDSDLEFAEEQLDVHRDLVGESSPGETIERGMLLAQRGRVHEVVDALIEALEIRHPQSEYILEALAIGCVHVYQLNRAQFWVQELLKKWPSNAIGRLLRAQTINTQGSRDRAIMQLQELVGDYPRYYQARLYLADILFKAQRYREAVIEYAALLGQKPGDMQPLLGLACSYDRLGNLDEARPLMKQLQEQYPDQSEVLLECGRFALHEKDPAAAEPLLRRALELAPHDHEVHRELGVCLARLGKEEESSKHLERSKQIEADLMLLEKTLAAMAKTPADPKPRREAARICLRNGQATEALRWLYGVLDMAPNDKPTHQMLADYFSSVGDSERAGYHSDRAR
jgi:Flp pilus assembly protein TadD